VVALGLIPEAISFSIIAGVDHRLRTRTQTDAQLIDEHRAIAAAIRAGDVTRSRNLAQHHLQPVIDTARQARPPRPN
jgi:DNA-binding GntR family transcriptional regulator